MRAWELLRALDKNKTLSNTEIVIEVPGLGEHDEPIRFEIFDVTKTDDSVQLIAGEEIPNAGNPIHVQYDS